MNKCFIKARWLFYKAEHIEGFYQNFGHKINH